MNTVIRNIESHCAIDCLSLNAIKWLKEEIRLGNFKSSHSTVGHWDKVKDISRIYSVQSFCNLYMNATLAEGSLNNLEDKVQRAVRNELHAVKEELLSNDIDYVHFKDLPY